MWYFIMKTYETPRLWVERWEERVSLTSWHHQAEGNVISVPPSQPSWHRPLRRSRKWRDTALWQVVLDFASNGADSWSHALRRDMLSIGETTSHSTAICRCSVTCCLLFIRRAAAPHLRWVYRWKRSYIPQVPQRQLAAVTIAWMHSVTQTDLLTSSTSFLLRHSMAIQWELSTAIWPVILWPRENCLAYPRIWMSTQLSRPW